MIFSEVLLIALGLAMDAFAVCLGAGTTQLINGPRPVFRLAFHFGLFQALMPVLGWLVGSTVSAGSRRSIIGSPSRCSPSSACA